MDEYKPKYYVLDKDHNILMTEDVFVWGKFFEKPERIVKQEYVGRHWVSTVFLGLDHSWSNGDKPLLFETMVFLRDEGDPLKVRDLENEKEDEWYDYQERYHTWKEALNGHRRIIRKLRKAEGK